MLVELRDVEVHVEPDEILKEAIMSGDLSLRNAMNIIGDNYNTEEMLGFFEEKDVQDFIGEEELQVSEIFDAVKAFNNEQKALLVWQLLKG